MKKTIITIASVVALVGAVNAQTFTLNPFTAGDTSITWNVSNPDGASGVLEANTDYSGGFRDARVNMINQYDNTMGVSLGAQTGVSFAWDATPQTISFTYDNQVISTNTTNALLRFGSIDSFTTINFDTPQTIADNLGEYTGATGLNLNIGDIVTTAKDDTSVPNRGSIDISDWSDSQFHILGTENLSQGQWASLFLVPVPEPSSSALLGLGALGLLARRKR